jgi:MarR family 2-MHQ and catechol resistance regulon transcriptional repressor
MRKAGPELTEAAFSVFVRATGLFRNRMDPYFARFGISRAQWGVLRQLQRAESEGLEALRLADLGRRMLVRPPSISSLVERLARMGLVARAASATDQRAKQVTLTSAGRRLVSRVLKRHPMQIQAMLASLTQAELGDLLYLMEKLVQHWESAGDASLGGRDVFLPSRKEPTP